jgi:hypothetical protein
LRRRLRRLRRDRLEREHRAVAQDAHLQALAVFRSRDVAGCDASGMPLPGDVEPQLAAARVANCDGFENGADAPLRDQARTRAAARSEEIHQVDTHLWRPIFTVPL